MVGQLPAVEMLVDAEGVSNVSYHGVIFEHSTWMRPSSPWGFVDVQAGWTLACAVGDPCSEGSGEGEGEQSETPAALSFRASTGVSISSCTFRHLGQNGVSFSHGSHSNSVEGSTFTDLSASAVAVGTRDNPTNKTNNTALQVICADFCVILYETPLADLDS